MLREAGIIRSKTGISLAARVLEIGTGLREVIQEFQPQAMAIEQRVLAGEESEVRLADGPRPRRDFDGGRRGRPPGHSFYADQRKEAVHGQRPRSKDQMQHAVSRELRLERLLEPNDVADASAVALCLYHRCDSSHETS